MANKWSERLLRTRAQVQTLIATSALNYPAFYQISNAVGATKQVLVWATSVNTITSFAENLTDGTIGEYDITADTFSVIFYDDTGVLSLVLTNGSKRMLDDAGANSVQISARQLIADDGGSLNLSWDNVLGIVLNTVMANGSLLDDAAAGVFGLTAGMPYYTNVAGEGILKIKL